MLKEEYLQHLLQALYERPMLNAYDFAAQTLGAHHEDFTHAKAWHDYLVREKLASYFDEERTVLQISNYGIFWIMKGGYEIYLRDGHFKDHDHNHKNHQTHGNGNGNGGKNGNQNGNGHWESHKEQIQREKEQLLEARLKLTRFRLKGFWLMLFVSLISLFLSLYNLYMIMHLPR